MKNILFAFLIINILSCQKDVQIGADGTGTGGSLARFTFAGNMMYVVTADSLKTFDVSKPTQPRYVRGEQLSATWFNTIETIFVFNNRLFIGSQSGMIMYEIDKDGKANFKSQVSHSWGCDPVVANDSMAFVTIRNGQRGCFGFSRANELQVYNVKNIETPILINTLNLTFPVGVGLDKNLLFVCDAGLKILDVSNPLSIKQLHFLSNIDALDVIPLNGQLLVIGAGKITQLDYKDIKNIKIISEFDLKK